MVEGASPVSQGWEAPGGGITSTGSFGSMAYLLSSGTCSIENTTVIGITAQSLKPA